MIKNKLSALMDDEFFATLQAKDDLTYVEPFMGGGAMFVHVIKKSASLGVRVRAVLNDKNTSIMNIYRAIQCPLSIDTFKSRLVELEHRYLSISTRAERKEFYYALRHEHAYDYEGYTSGAIESATLYFLMKLSYNGIYNVQRNTNDRFGTPCGSLSHKNKVVDYELIDWWHENLRCAELLSGDWRPVVDGARLTSRTEPCLVFMDPPYRDSHTTYGGNVMTDADHIDLLQYCDGLCKLEHVFIVLTNRDDNDWFKHRAESMGLILNHTNIDVVYTVGACQRASWRHGVTSVNVSDEPCVVDDNRSRRMLGADHMKFYRQCSITAQRHMKERSNGTKHAREIIFYG